MTNKSIRDYINLIEDAQREEVEESAEGWTKLPNGNYRNMHTGVVSSKPPVKKKRGEKTGAEWDAIEKAKKDKEQSVSVEQVEESTPAAMSKIDNLFKDR